MRAEFSGGATVSRCYASTEQAELVALFAYNRDAEEFAKAKLAEDRSNFKETTAFYLVACSYDGRVKIFRQPAADEAKAA